MRLTLPQNLHNWIQDTVAQEPRILDWASVSLSKGLPREDLLQKWIGDGNHADMDWIPAGLAARLNPGMLLDGAQSAVIFLWKYPQPLVKASDNTAFQVAAYAHGEDYHRAAGRWLQEILNKLAVEFPNVRSRSFVDTLPIQERAWAAESGLGWIGKNSLLIHPSFGSGFFLAGFLTTEILEKRSVMDPGKEFCGKCTRCIEACPTQAIWDNCSVDSRRCISYLTIEKRNEFSEEESRLVKGWMFGCDICQTVCPWNLKHLQGDRVSFWPTDSAEWAELLVPGNGLRNRLRGTPLDRAGRKGLLRNFQAQKKDPG